MTFANIREATTLLVKCRKLEIMIVRVKNTKEEDNIAKRNVINKAG
jgi:hypothetical protein